MTVYDVSGNKVLAVYDIGGNTVDKIYDVSGNVASDLVVMSYNVQRFGGVNSNVDIVDDIFMKYNPDIIGFQEYYTTSQMDGVDLPTFLGRYWRNLEIGDTKIANYTKAVASNLELTEPSTVYYTVYSESRSYQKMYVTVNGKRIAIFHTHLDYDNLGSPQTSKVKQMKELFDAVSQEEYFIAFGDVNTVCQSTADADYINMIKQFVDAGYNCANCSEQHGFYGTWTNGTTETNGLWEQNDNIITSANIDIRKVIIDRTKIDANTGGQIDHLPLVAYLSVR
jgi:endonuclease/exonuclease/phosphatase family metal-dependent hydrolase